MMDDQDQGPRLNTTSYIVLGLLVRAGGQATPYALKRMASTSVGNFWSLHHAQLYAEPERLARAGLLREEREAGGRRRRSYSVTPAGRAALEAWLQVPAAVPGELRDPGLLQLFFGADRQALAGPQRELHAAKLREYESLHEAVAARMPVGERLALEAGIAHEREWVRFWSDVGARR